MDPFLRVLIDRITNQNMDTILYFLLGLTSLAESNIIYALQILKINFLDI